MWEMSILCAYVYVCMCVYMVYCLRVSTLNSLCAHSAKKADSDSDSDSASTCLIIKMCGSDKHGHGYDGAPTERRWNLNLLHSGSSWEPLKT